MERSTAIQQSQQQTLRLFLVVIVLTSLSGFAQETKTNGSSEVWQTAELNDNMSDTTTTVAKTEIRGEHGGVLSVVAHCENDLSLEIYVAPLTTGLAFKRSPMSQHITTYQGAGAVGTGVASPPKDCAVLKVRAGSGVVKEMASQLCEDDINAELIFPGDAAKVAKANFGMIGSLISLGGEDDEESKRGARAGAEVGDMMAKLAGRLSAPIDAVAGIIRMPDVIAADFLRMQLPFTNGQQPIIEIHPQAPVLKSYLARCVAPSSSSTTSTPVGAPNGSRERTVGSTASPASPPEFHATTDQVATAFDEHTLRLTPTNLSESRTATITAPGRGLQNYNLFHIDTRDFAGGGTLIIDIEISGSSATDGSFDLFPDGVPIPVRGSPTGTLTGRYDVRRGSLTRLEYRFGRGQVFALGLEGNWFSPKGTMGDVHFRASVRK